MQARSRDELYRAFLDFIGAEIQRERHKVNRRMFSVFLWCFLVPAVVTASAMLLAKLHVLPGSARGYAGWLILIFPILYSLYVLSSEVLVEVPNAFRRGGMANTLNFAVRESEWRGRTWQEMRRLLGPTSDEWDFIIFSFRTDLEQLQNRVRYLTALAGAVFYLVMQGLDSMTGTEPSATFIKHPVLGWMEASDGDSMQYVGLALFLILLYLSGNQTYLSLRRYLVCAELAARESAKR